MKFFCYFVGMETGKERAERLFKENRCVLCGDSGKTLRLGLCPKHYAAYYRRTLNMDPEKKALLDAELVDAGELIENRQGKRSKEDSSLEKRIARINKLGFTGTSQEMLMVAESRAVDDNSATQDAVTKTSKKTAKKVRSPTAAEVKKRLEADKNTKKRKTGGA